MSIRIEPYSAKHQEAWDAFVKSSRNGTFFHTRAFLNYHPEEKFQDASLIIYKDDAIAAVLPAALIEDGKKFVSHPGASYGGLVLSSDNGMKETGEIVSAVMEHVKFLGVEAIYFLRLTPPSVRKAYSDDQEFWLNHNAWTLLRMELATSLFLDGLDDESLLLKFSGKCRNSVRQGQKSGLKIELSQDFDAFWPILTSAMKDRHDATPTHSLEEIKKLQSLCPQDVRLITASKDGKVIAGIVFIALHDGAIYTLYIAQDFAFQQDRPLPLLVYELAKLCLKEKKRVLHFGISTEDGGMIVNEGLFFFKESFGGVSVRRETWMRLLKNL